MTQPGARWPNKRFVALSDDQAEWLRAEAERRGVSESSLLREAFEEHRQRRIEAEAAPSAG